MRKAFRNAAIFVLSLCGTLEVYAQECPPADTAAPVDTLCPAGTEDDIEAFSLDDDIVEHVFDTVDMPSGDSEFPAHAVYSQIWHNSEINPYKIRLVDTPDTVLIDLSGYHHPIVNRITSDFGFRRRFRHHYGIDIKLRVGDSVRCAFDGKVRIAQRSRTYGYYVVVRHYNGLETVYAHLSKLLVKPNEAINAGTTLGLGGSTGRSTGPHLHFELRYLGVPVNPNDIIDFTAGTPHRDTLYLSSAHFNYIKEIEKIRFYTVRQGDTLGHIAQRTGVPVGTLCRLNSITRKSIIRPGQRIRYT
ncbi:MAG: peptidoglycan DD-metalloendopeptidase family protein [Prevotellaceae bacterium]|nr:peptidoglycan DD-metalloendopeptidase family protein [Prevotellaceae bacterium]